MPDRSASVLQRLYLRLRWFATEVPPPIRRLGSHKGNLQGRSRKSANPRVFTNSLWNRFDQTRPEPWVHSAAALCLKSSDFVDTTPGRRGRASAPALDGERRAAGPGHPGAARLRHTSDQGHRSGSAWRVGGVALGVLATRGRDRGPARARCGKRGNGRDRGCRCRGRRLEPEVRKAGAKRGRPDKGAVLAS